MLLISRSFQDTVGHAHKNNSRQSSTSHSTVQWSGHTSAGFSEIVLVYSAVSGDVAWLDLPSIVFIAFHLQRHAVLSIFFNDQALSSIRNRPEKIRIIDFIFQAKIFHRQHAVTSRRHSAKHKVAFGIRAGPAEQVGRAGLGHVWDQQD